MPLFRNQTYCKDVGYQERPSFTSAKRAEDFEVMLGAEPDGLDFISTEGGDYINRPPGVNRSVAIDANFFRIRTTVPPLS